MDISSLEATIRSAIANPAEIQKDEKQRMSLLSAARALVQTLEPPDEAISNVAVVSAGRFMCVRVALDLGLFDLLAEKSPQTIKQLAQSSHGEDLLILRLLRSLAAMGYVEERGENTFAATVVTKTLTKDHVKAGIVHWHDHGLPAIAQTPAYFRANSHKSPETSTTGPIQYTFSTPLNTYAYWHTLPGVMENFNTFMNGHFAGMRLSWLEWFPMQQQVVDGFDESVSKVLFVDVGGGRGHEADAVRRKFPDIKGKVVVQDLPGVIDDVRGLDERVELVKHDFFQAQPIKGSRTYFLSNILHNWPDGEALQILQHLRSAMIPKYSKVLLADFILPNTGCPPRALGLDIGMMVLHSGIQRSERQWEELMGKAGLRVQKFWNAPGDGDGIVEVVRDQ